MTDSERLDKLEAIILEGTVLWDGRGEFPLKTYSGRNGLSLLADSPKPRGLREAIDAMADRPKSAQ